MMGNFFRKMVGRIFLKAQQAGDYVATTKIKKRLASCGNNVRIERNCHIIPEHVSIGDNVSIGYSCSLMASIAHIYIGNNVMLAPGVVIRGGDHRIDLVGRYIIDIKEDEKLPENDQDVHIGEDVWIGQNAIILKGVTIGEGSIIGAGAIVTKDIPPYTIYIGSHSPIQKDRFTKEQIEQHRKLINDKEN